MRQVGMTVMLVCITLFASRAIRGRQSTEPIHYTALWAELALDTVTNEYDETAKVLLQSRVYPMLNASIARVYDTRQPICRHAFDRCEILHTAVSQLQDARSTKSRTWNPYPVVGECNCGGADEDFHPFGRRARVGFANVPVFSAVVLDNYPNARPLYSKSDFLNSALVRPWRRCCKLD